MVHDMLGCRCPTESWLAYTGVRALPASKPPSGFSNAKITKCSTKGQGRGSSGNPRRWVRERGCSVSALNRCPFLSTLAFEILEIFLLAPDSPPLYSASDTAVPSLLYPRTRKDIFTSRGFIHIVLHFFFL